MHVARLCVHRSARQTRHPSDERVEPVGPRVPSRQPVHVPRHLRLPQPPQYRQPALRDGVGRVRKLLTRRRRLLPRRVGRGPERPAVRPTGHRVAVPRRHASRLGRR